MPFPKKKYQDLTYFPKKSTVSALERSFEWRLKKAMHEANRPLLDVNGRLISTKKFFTCLLNNSGNVCKTCQQLKADSWQDVSQVLQDSTEFQDLLKVFQWKRLQKAADKLDELLECGQPDVELKAAKAILDLYKKPEPKVAVNVTSDDKQVRVQVMEAFGIRGAEQDD